MTVAIQQLLTISKPEIKTRVKINVDGLKEKVMITGIILDDTQIKNALDFMLFSYFKATFDVGSLFEGAVRAAYNDATMRNALVLKNPSKKNKPNYQKAYDKCEKERKAIHFIVKEQIIRITMKAVDDLSKYTGNFNKWHENICNKLVNGDKEYIGFDNSYDNLSKQHNEEFYNLDKDHPQYFTIGNAQKLINMTLKNLYIITTVSSLCEGNEKAQEWCDKFSWIYDINLDIHIDSYILNYTGIKKVTWSKISEYNRYLELQKEIKGNLKTVDDECPAWIEKADDEKKNDIDKIIHSNSKILGLNKDEYIKLI